MNLIQIILSVLGFVTGIKTGHAEAGPQIPQGLFTAVDKFAGIIAGAGAIYWFLGNRETVITLNYLELAAVILIFNIILKFDPPPSSS